MSDSRSPGCPPEFMNIPVPKGDPVFDPTASGKVLLPFQRGPSDKGSGQNPGNPRRQVLDPDSNPKHIRVAHLCTSLMNMCRSTLRQPGSTAAPSTAPPPPGRTRSEASLEDVWLRALSGICRDGQRDGPSCGALQTPAQENTALGACTVRCSPLV